MRPVDHDQDSNVYGGTPHVVQWGDMGGPVYSTDKGPKIVAVVTGFVDNEYGEAEATPTDLFSPIINKNKEWMDGVVREAQRGRIKIK